MSQREALHRPACKTCDVTSELVHHIGYESAMRLIKHFGGTTMWIPSGKSVWPQDVEAVLGKDATSKLIWAFGGNELYIPMRHKEALLYRNVSICLEYEELLRAAMGAQEAVKKLARQHNFSDRHIWSILKGTDPEAVTVERRRRRVVGQDQESASRAPDGSVPLKTNQE